MERSEAQKSQTREKVDEVTWFPFRLHVCSGQQGACTYTDAVSVGWSESGESVPSRTLVHKQKTQRVHERLMFTMKNERIHTFTTEAEKWKKVAENNCW